MRRGWGFCLGSRNSPKTMASGAPPLMSLVRTWGITRSFLESLGFSGGSRGSRERSMGCCVPATAHTSHLPSGLKAAACTASAWRNLFADFQAPTSQTWALLVGAAGGQQLAVGAEGHARHPVAVLADGGHQPLVGQAPDVGLAVGRAAGQEIGLAADGQGVDHVLGPLQQPGLPAAGDLEQADVARDAGAALAHGQQAAVLAEGQGVDGGQLAGAEAFEQLGALEVPQHDAPGVARRQEFPVGTEGHGRYGQRRLGAGHALDQRLAGRRERAGRNDQAALFPGDYGRRGRPGRGRLRPFARATSATARHSSAAMLTKCPAFMLLALLLRCLWTIQTYMISLRIPPLGTSPLASGVT